MGKRFTEYSQFDTGEQRCAEEMGRKPGFRQEYDRT